MKKGIITLLVALSAVCSAWAGTPSKISELARQFKDREGFEVVSVGRLLLRGMLGVARMDKDLDAEDRAALHAFDGVRRLTVIDFADASEADKASFGKKVNRILDGMELILEAKDSSETIRIYGIDDGQRIKDVVLFSPDGDLISISGTIDLEQIGRLTEMTK